MNSSNSQSDLLTPLKNSYIFNHIHNDILETLSTELISVSLSEEETLFQQDEPSDALYIILQGVLRATLTQMDGHQIILGEMGAGDIVGEIHLLAGGKRTASVIAVSETELVKLPKAAFENWVNRYPTLLQKMAEIITQRLRRGQLLKILPNLFGPCDETTLREIEDQIEWVHIHSGEALFRQGEVGDSLYLVVSGRLQAVIEDGAGDEQVIGEIAQGESVGEMALFAGENRTATVYALRDCELVKLSNVAFDQIIQKSPQMMRSITQIIIRRLKKGFHASSTQSTVVNIAIVPMNPNKPLTIFCERLTSALSAIDSTLHLSSKHLDELMGVSGVAQIPRENPQSIRLVAYLDEQETRYQFILYEADSTQTRWTEWCLRRADQILLVADAKDNPGLSKIEKTLLSYQHRISTASQTLILLHPDGQQLPVGTQQWLSVRSVKNHHHIRWDTEADFERLARFISGRAIGLVLGGGGMRGFAHVGVFLALKEAGIPIDMIGGTSVGALIGAQCAMGWERETIIKINHKGLVESNPYNGYTLPFVSLVSSRKLKANLTMAFGDTQIEDLWINFFCISSNLSAHNMMIHREGRLEKAIRATSAVPGLIQPVLKNRELLVDGGVVNNLPGDVMRQFCGKIIAVDVSGELNLTIDYEEIPSSWEIFWSRLLPFRKPLQVPSILDILLGTTLLTSNERTQMVKADADFYLKPPVEKFKLLQFSALEEIVDVGYQYAKKEIEKWGGKIG